MPFYQFKKTQFLPSNKNDVWSFISSPENLKKITPSYMGFDITSPLEESRMYSGMIISYMVKPLLNIPIKWISEITHIRETEYFVDEQRVGPYSLWHHEHHLKEVENGVMMTDIVSYKPPFGIFGALMNALFIRRKLEEIFEFRRKTMGQVFWEV